MKLFITTITLALAAAFLQGCATAHADAINPPPLLETRYCGAPARNADGSIKRRSDVLTAFQRAHPCPSTGLTTGACPGWAKDHVVPLASCGCDSVSNLQWMPDGLKSAAGTLAKDRWERKVYVCPGSPAASVPLP